MAAFPIIYVLALIYFAIIKPKAQPELSSSPKYLFYLCLFFGIFGVHRFREGKKWTGLLYLCTLGLCFVGWIYDMFKYAIADYRKDSPAAAKLAQPVEDQALIDLQNGAPLPVVMDSGLFLTSGEVCHYCDLATRVIFKNRVVGYEGGSSGVSVRVMKGVSYRVGQSRGTPIRKDVQDRIDGVLSITNKRVVFTATRNSFDKKLSALTLGAPANGGIVLQFGDKEFFLALNRPEYVYQLITRIVQETTE